MTTLVAAGRAAGTFPASPASTSVDPAVGAAVTLSDLDLFDGHDPTVAANGAFDAVRQFNEGIASTLLDGLTSLAERADEFDDSEKLGTDIFLVNASLGELVDLGGELSTGLVEPVASFVEANPLAHISELTDYLSDLPLVESASGQIVGDVFEVTLALRGVRQTAGVDLILGDDVLALIETEDLLATVVSEFVWTLETGVDLAGLSTPANAFFVNTGTPARLSADAEFTDAFSGRAGFLGLEFGLPSQVVLDADVTLSLQNPDVDARGRGTRAELAESSLEQLVSQTGQGIVDISLLGRSVGPGPFANGVPGAADQQDTPAAISYFIDAFVEQPAVQSNNFDSLGIAGFHDLNATTMLQQLRQLSSFLDGFGTSTAFQMAAPLVGGVTITDFLSLDGFYAETVLDPITEITEDGDSVPKFDTLQELAALLDGSIAEVSFDPASRLLQFSLFADGTLAAVDGATLALPDLGSLTRVTSESTISLIPSVTIDLGVTAELTPLGSNLAGLSPATLVSELSRGRGVRTIAGATDIEIHLSNGTSFEVDLTAPDPDSQTIRELLAVIQAAADSATGDSPTQSAEEKQFLIEFDFDSAVFAITDRSLSDPSAGALPLRVDPLNDSRASVDLGLTGDGFQLEEGGTEYRLDGRVVHGDTLDDHFAVQAGKIRVELDVAAADASVQGRWGPVAVAVDGGTASGTTELVYQLADPATSADDGRATFRELVSGIGQPETLVESITAKVR